MEDSQPSVTWLPAHPSEGSYSMQTYWQELVRARAEGDPFRIDCPISTGQWTGRRASRLRRAWDRYVAYPRQVAGSCTGAVAHILDHSSAHLLDRIGPETRTVVTVHDLIPLVDPSGLSPRQVGRFRRVVERLRGADRLVAVSEHTKGELMRLLSIPAERITVVPNGVCHSDASAPGWDGKARLDGLRAGGAQLVIGSVGSTLARKNLEVLARAAEVLSERGVSVSVARVGGPVPEGLRGAFEEAIPPGHFVEFGRLGSGELAEFYRAVDVVVVPSRHEGFGLPVLEAMQFGRPVVASRSTSLPEVGGEAALYFDPDDSGALADHLVSLLDAGERGKWRAAGLERVTGFSWRSHLAALYGIYAELGGLVSPTKAAPGSRT